MQEGAGPEWDHIDQPTLEEVEKSWAHSRCGEVKFYISVSMCVCQSSRGSQEKSQQRVVWWPGLPYGPATDMESV